MTRTDDHFPTDVTGLPEARAPEEVELANGDEYALRLPPCQAVGDDMCGCSPTTARFPGPMLRVDGGLGDRRRDRKPGRHGRHGPLARPAAGQPLRRHARDPVGDRVWASATPRTSRSPIPASTGTTRTSARTTARRWASTATSSSSRPTPTTGRPSIASSPSPLDDLLLEDGQVAPFSRAETTHVAMGRFGEVMLVNGETDLVVGRTAGRGRPPLPDQHCEHARVQDRRAGRAHEAGRR